MKTNEQDNDENLCTISQSEINCISNPIIANLIKSLAPKINKLPIIPWKNGHYRGPLIKNKPHGVGKFTGVLSEDKRTTESDYITYIGNWNNGSFTGLGIKKSSKRLGKEDRDKMSTVFFIGDFKDDYFITGDIHLYDHLISSTKLCLFCSITDSSVIEERNGFTQKVIGTFYYKDQRLYTGEILTDANWNLASITGVGKLNNNIFIQHHPISVLKTKIDNPFQNYSFTRGINDIFSSLWVIHTELDSLCKEIFSTTQAPKYLFQSECQVLNGCLDGEGAIHFYSGEKHHSSYKGNWTKNKLHGPVQLHKEGEKKIVHLTFENGKKMLSLQEQEDQKIIIEELLNDQNNKPEENKKVKPETKKVKTSNKPTNQQDLINTLSSFDKDNLYNKKDNNKDDRSVADSSLSIDTKLTGLTGVTGVTAYTETPTVDRIGLYGDSIEKQILNELSKILKKKITKKALKTLEPLEMLELNKLVTAVHKIRTQGKMPPGGVEYLTTPHIRCKTLLNKITFFFKHIKTDKINGDPELKSITKVIEDIAESFQSTEDKHNNILIAIKNYFGVNQLESRNILRIIGSASRDKGKTCKSATIANDIVICKGKGKSITVFYRSYTYNIIRLDKNTEDKEALIHLNNFQKLASSSDGGTYTLEKKELATSVLDAISYLSSDAESRVNGAISKYLAAVEEKDRRILTITDPLDFFPILKETINDSLLSKHQIPINLEQEHESRLQKIEEIAQSNGAREVKQQQILDLIDRKNDLVSKPIEKYINRYLELIETEKKGNDYPLDNPIISKKNDEKKVQNVPSDSFKENLKIRNSLPYKIESQNKEIDPIEKKHPKSQLNSDSIAISKQQIPSIQNISELEYQDDEILELLDCYLKENNITQYQPKSLSINGYLKFKDIGYLIAHFTNNPEGIENLSNILTNQSIKKTTALTIKIDQYVNELASGMLDKDKLKQQLKLYFADIQDQTITAEIKGKLGSLKDDIVDNVHFNNTGQIESLALKETRPIDEKIFTLDNITFVAIHPGPIGLTINNQSYSDFGDKFRQALWELNNYLTVHTEYKNNKIEFLFPLNLGNYHWILGRATLESSVLTFQFHDPIANGATIKNYPNFIKEVNTGLNSFKNTIQTFDTSNRFLQLETEFTSIKQDHKNVQKGLYCGGAALRMMLGAILNKGDVYNWTNIEKNGRDVVDTNYTDSKKARENDLKILRDNLRKDSGTTIIYEKLLVRYRNNGANNKNKPLAHQATEYTKDSEYPEKFLTQFQKQSTYQIATFIKTLSTKEQDLLIKYWETRIRDQYCSLLDLDNIQIINSTTQYYEFSTLEDKIVGTIHNRIITDWETKDNARITQAKKDSIKLITILSQENNTEETEAITNIRKELIDLVTLGNKSMQTAEKKIDDNYNR